MVITRRNWLIAGGLAAVVVVLGATAAVVLSNRAPSDCAVVSSIIDYNNQFNESVRQKSDARVETSDSDYTEWAARIKQLADQIHNNQGLAEQADKLADLAGQTAALVPRYRAESSAMSPLETTPPESVRDYSRIGTEFNDTLAVLDNACPS
ncbi:hypothetical protein [Mycobacterium hubeiense]|uniref:hypothetical protein n=1 Tax=Mycobacterium hubeiense TaxID=1867256 RepID=UPI001159951A|nr:hypothetical protein [Mycobacterium sp. QGD 101]